jgi:hypothetical protein
VYGGRRRVYLYEALTMSSIIKVFLASPSDLNDERRVVRARAEQFNKLWSDEYGVYFRVVGWEDLPPVSQRPQHRINRDADDCHVFIGMMATRWGTDSGEFSSGFEEEFTSANTRRKSKGIPEIALFFRAIDSAMLSDPGPQLSKVMQFKHSIIESKEFLFKEFATGSELSDFVDGVFSEYAKTRKEQLAVQSGAIEPKPETAEAARSSESHEPVDSSSIDAVLSAASANAALGTSDLLDFWSRLRLLVYSTSIYSELYDHVSLGLHEVNLAFRKRKEWRLAEEERRALIAAMLRDSNHYTPGWYWLAEGGLAITRLRLWHFCMSGSGGKRAAAAILANDDELPAETDHVRNALMDPETAPSICRLLARIGTAEHLPFLADAKADIAIERIGQQPVAAAEFAIRLRAGLKMTDESVVAYAALGIDAARSLLRFRIEAMETERIRALISDVPEGLARAILTQIVLDAGKLEPELAEPLLKDQNPRVREIGVRALIAGGRAFVRADLETLFPKPGTTAGGALSVFVDQVDIDLLMRESLGLKGFEELKALINFFELDAPAALAVMIEHHWSAYESEIAHQLDCDYQELLEAAEARSMAIHGFSIVGIWKEKGGSNLIDYVRANFLEAALSGVRRHGHLRASEWSRKFAGVKYPEKVRAVAFQILARLAEPFEYNKLLDQFAELPADSAIMFLPAILRNTALDTNALDKMCAHPSDDVRDALKSILIDTWREDYAQLLEPMLLATVDKTRLLAATVMARRLGAASLERLLDRYVELSTYYYDVVTILDEMAYAVPPFRERLLGDQVIALLGAELSAPGPVS